MKNFLVSFLWGAWKFIRFLLDWGLIVIVLVLFFFIFCPIFFFVWLLFKERWEEHRLMEELENRKQKTYERKLAGYDQLGAKELLRQFFGASEADIERLKGICTSMEYPDGSNVTIASMTAEDFLAEFGGALCPDVLYDDGVAVAISFLTHYHRGWMEIFPGQCKENIGKLQEMEDLLSCNLVSNGTLASEAQSLEAQSTGIISVGSSLQRGKGSAQIKP